MRLRMEDSTTKARLSVSITSLDSSEDGRSVSWLRAQIQPYHTNMTEPIEWPRPLTNQNSISNKFID